MARNVPIRRGAGRWGVFLLCGLGLWAMAFLSGCTRAAFRELEKPYSFEERPFVLEDVMNGKADTAPLFAQDLCVAADESAFDPAQLDAEAGALFSLSDKQVLYGKNLFKRLYPASTTKVMTALLAIKYADLDAEVTVTEGAMVTEAGATLCGIAPGDVLAMRQLLYGLMLPSGNDAASAIAIAMSGSLEGFAKLMNEEAEALGATNTHFVNPHGLHNEDHYTTAYDLYLIFQEALKYPEFREVTRCAAYAADYKDKDANAVNKTWEGGNWYLTGKRQVPHGVTVFSGKTGTTKAAGCCLIMASRKEGTNEEYISVVMKADNRDSLYENMTKIISKIVN